MGEAPRRPRVAEKRIGRMDNVVLGQRRCEPGMPGRQIGVVGYIADQAGGTEHTRQQHIAHRWRQLDPAGPLPAEMDRQVEPVRALNRRLGEALPAFDMTPGLLRQFEIDEDSDL
jgi:hypothetical protein